MSYMQKLDEEDRAMFAAVVERLAAQRFSIERCRAASILCDPDEWSAFAGQGIMALGIGPEFGGVGGGVADQAMVMRQIGLNLLPLPYLDTVVVGAFLIAELGDETQRAQLLPAIAGGELRLAFAHREPESGDLFDHVATRVTRDGVSGQKIQVIHSGLAARLIVSARDAQGVPGFHLIDRDQPGVRFENYRLPDNRIASRVTFENAAAEPLGGDAAHVLERLHERLAVCAAAETAGAMAGVNRDTLDYAKVRTQFGRSIGSFQVLQHRMVDMFIAEQIVSALVSDAAAMIDQGGVDAGMRASAAKAQADRSGRLVGEAAIQIHGGMGLTDECSAGHYLKRILVNGSLYGTAAAHVARLATR